jgi:ribosomal protein S18 acetylase RimI-like enzyme
MAFKLLNYQSDYQKYFEAFNRAWLETYFSVEPIDEWVLQHPEEAILNDGGAIYFAEFDSRIIGTVALKRIDSESFELTKMAVDKPYQGLGAGKFLCREAVAHAKKLGAQRLVLYSQTCLAPAIGIYKALGFKEIPLDQKYQRADIKMELIMNQNEEN